MQIVSQAPAAAALSLNLSLVSSAATSAFVVAAGEPGAGTQVNLPVPGSNKVNGQPFRVRAAGYLSILAATAATTAATPLQIMLFGSNTASFSIASGNVLCSLTAVAAYTQAAAATVAVFMPWAIEAQLMGVNGGSLAAFNLGGSIQNPNGVQLVTIPVLTTTSVGAAGSFNSLVEPAAQISVGISGAANANIGTSVTAFLTQFVLEQ